ncbi:MAG: hypothetical protein ABIB97_04755 [Patescibacteria group bacterium]
MPKQVNKAQLETGYWFLTHRNLVKRIGLIIFMLVDLIIVCFFLYNIITYFAMIPFYNRLVANLGNEIIDYSGIHQRTAPRPLQITEETILLAPTGNYDLMAKIRNPNDRWIIDSFQYRFTVSGSQTDWQTSHLADSENKYLFYFGHENYGSGSLLNEEVTVEIDNVIYRRIIHPDKVPRIDFVVEDPQHDTVYLADSDERVSRVTANIKNNTVYSFWEVGVQIILYSYDDPVAINLVTIDNFDTLLTKNLDILWRGRVAGVTSVLINPFVNIVDNDNYKKYHIEI